MKKPNFLLMIIILLATGLISCKQKKTKTIENENNALKTYVDSLINPLVENSYVAGLAIGVAQNGKIQLIKSYGYFNLENKTPLENDALFPIASISKTITANAILQLVEEGKINLDDDLTKYVDFYTKEHQVTVRELLNHTSGIKDYTESDIPNKLIGTDYSPIDLLNLLEQKKFDFQPGGAMDYNNSGYYILALIIEKVSGYSFNEYIQKHIFEPLKMNNSINGYTNGTKVKLVKGYNMDREGTLHPAQIGDFRLAIGAGSLCSTIEDLLIWQIALHQSKSLLSKKSYELMTTRNKLKEGSLTNYGLGLEINQYNGNKVFSHNGVIEGYLSDSRYFPDANLSIVTLVNTLGKVKPTKISNSVSEFYLEKKDISQHFKGDLTNYEGTYNGIVMGNNLSMDILRQSEQLILESRGNKVPLQFIGQNTWLAEDDYTYSFLEGKMQVNSPKMSILFNKE